MAEMISEVGPKRTLDKARVIATIDETNELFGTDFKPTGNASVKRFPGRGDEGVMRSRGEGSLRERGEEITHPEIRPGYLPGMHAGFYDYDSETITLCDPWLLYDQEGLESLRDKFEGVLTHEFMHHLLFKMEGRETAEKYDNLFCQCNEWPPKCDSEERKRWEELYEYLKKKEAGEAN